MLSAFMRAIYIGASYSEKPLTARNVNNLSALFAGIAGEQLKPAIPTADETTSTTTAAVIAGRKEH
ncbi:MAG: hypothetical protein CMP23_10860 [Rickettsiales bacterium]|nr:hypothetical protein [Rickettsiales bacterium]|tara:strand:- start:998 stop:1195 length:198 start_codon:yes stop_codon:yes gene_type:complete